MDVYMKAPGTSAGTTADPARQSFTRAVIAGQTDAQPLP